MLRRTMAHTQSVIQRRNAKKLRRLSRPLWQRCNQQFTIISSFSMLCRLTKSQLLEYTLTLRLNIAMDDDISTNSLRGLDQLRWRRLMLVVVLRWTRACPHHWGHISMMGAPLVESTAPHSWQGRSPSQCQCTFTRSLGLPAKSLFYPASATLYLPPSCGPIKNMRHIIGHTLDIIETTSPGAMDSSESSAALYSVRTLAGVGAIRRLFLRICGD